MVRHKPWTEYQLNLTHCHPGRVTYCNAYRTRQGPQGDTASSLTEIHVDKGACGTSPTDFTTAEVLGWLENELDLSQFKGEFLAHNVNGATVEEIAKADLEWLGVKNPIKQAQIVGE